MNTYIAKTWKNYEWRKVRKGDQIMCWKTSHPVVNRNRGEPRCWRRVSSSCLL